MERGKSLINNRKRVGPRIEPSGTPDFTYVNADLDEILSKLLQYIKEKNLTDTLTVFVRSVGWSDGQHENSIPSHKHSFQGVI